LLLSQVSMSGMGYTLVWTLLLATGVTIRWSASGLPRDVDCRHPHWAATITVVACWSGKPFLDPANPEARNLSLFDEIVSRYQVMASNLLYSLSLQDPSAERTYGYGRRRIN